MGPMNSNLVVQSNNASVAAQGSARPAEHARPAGSAAPVAKNTASSASAESVRQAIEQVNATLERVSVGVEFSLDQASGRVIVRVVDSETEEILRQIPSEQMLAIARAIEDLRGLLIQQEA